MLTVTPRNFDDPRYPKEAGVFFWSQRYSFRFQTHDSFGMWQNSRGWKGIVRTYMACDDCLFLQNDKGVEVEVIPIWKWWVVDRSDGIHLFRVSKGGCNFRIQIQQSWRLDFTGSFWDVSTSITSSKKHHSECLQKKGGFSQSSSSRKMASLDGNGVLIVKGITPERTLDPESSLEVCHGLPCTWLSLCTLGPKKNPANSCLHEIHAN